MQTEPNITESGKRRAEMPNFRMEILQNQPVFISHPYRNDVVRYSESS